MYVYMCNTYLHLYIYTCVCKYCAIHLADNPPAPLAAGPAGVEWRHGAGFSPPRSGRCGDFSAGVDRRSAQGPSGRRHRLSRAERCGAEQSGWGKKAGFQECYGDMRIYWKYYIGDMGFRGIIPRRITMCLSTWHSCDVMQGVYIYLFIYFYIFLYIYIFIYKLTK